MPKPHVLLQREALDLARLEGKVITALAYQGCEMRAARGALRVGRMMARHGLKAEIDHASRHDTLDLVPVLVDGCLVRAPA